MTAPEPCSSASTKRRARDSARAREGQGSRAAGRRGPAEPRLAGRLALPRARGFTLAEALIASGLLAVATLAVAGTLAASSQQARQLSQSGNCQSLARELIEEVTGRSFTAQPNAGWVSNAHDRSTYDDAAD